MKKILKQGLFYFMAFSVVSWNSAVSLNINWTTTAHAQELVLEKISTEVKTVEPSLESEEPSEPVPEQSASQATATYLVVPSYSGTTVYASTTSSGVLVTWDQVDPTNFYQYKVIISKNNPAPVYDADGYMPPAIGGITETSRLVANPLTYNEGDFTGDLECGVPYYFSVTTRYTPPTGGYENVPAINGSVQVIYNGPECQSQPVCGDGAFESPEQCDDGNQVDGDGCSANCSLETGYECEDLTSQNGWYGQYFNYLAIHPDMNRPSGEWPDAGHGDPLGVWDTDWYDSQYFRFNRVDSNLNFGGNFFPMDFAAEEINNGHDYHFGVHWRAEVTAPVADDYEFSATSDDDLWVYLDGVLVADNAGIHAPSTVNGVMSLDDSSHIVDIFFAERHVTQSHMSFDFASGRLIIVPMPEDCEDPGYSAATVIAHKIVCDQEIDLPNWSGGANITADTAQNYVDTHPSCHFAPDWKFEWGTNDSLLSLNGDYIGEHNVDGWYDFDSLTDVNGQAEVVLNLDELPGRLWFREVLQPGYIPYSYPPGSGPGSDVSAEFWCNIDVLNYDNAEWIDVSVDNTYYCVAFNAQQESGYSPYCGDGIVNQEWEQCDGLSDPNKGVVGCSQQCQYVVPQECSDLVLAKINVDDVQNWGLGDMTSDLFLGSNFYKIPSNVWFALYWNGSYFTDADVAGYEDVPGLAVQRLADSLRVVMYGSSTNEDKEHVDGYIEFYNATLTDQHSDNSNAYPNSNQLENGFNGTGVGNYNAGNDEVWPQDGNSYYWLTTTTADDGYYSDWAIIDDCEEDIPYAPWCSALFGIVLEAMDSQIGDEAYNEVADVFPLGAPDGLINLSDFIVIQEWYGQGLNDTCYRQFEYPENEYHFQCEDPSVGWCEGLLQGLKDSINSREGDANYFYVFDLWPANPDGTHGEGVIDLSDVIIMSELLGAGDQQACYAYYVPPFFMCENPQPYCGDGIQNGDEECDGTDGVLEGYYCTDLCVLETIPNGDYYCGDGIQNGDEECDGTDGVPDGYQCVSCNLQEIPSDNPSSGGGGGGGGRITSSISNIDSDISCDGNAISWMTSKNSVSWIVYGTTPGVYDHEYKDGVAKTGHSVVLPDLDPNTDYYFKIKSDDGTTIKESSEYGFTTLSAAQCGEVLGVKEIATCDYIRPSGSHGIDQDIINVFQFSDGTLVRDGCSANLAVYLVKDQKKWHIPSWQYLNDNYRGQRIYNVASQVIATYRNWDGKVLGVKSYGDGTLLRGNDHKIYVIKGGKRSYISTLAELQKYAGQPIFDVSDKILNQY